MNKNQIKTVTAVGRKRLTPSTYIQVGNTIEKWIVREREETDKDTGDVYPIGSMKKVGTFVTEWLSDVYGNPIDLPDTLVCRWKVSRDTDKLNCYRVDHILAEGEAVEPYIKALKETNHIICGEVQTEPGLYQQRKAPLEWNGRHVIEVIAYTDNPDYEDKKKQVATARLTRTNVSID